MTTEMINNNKIEEVKVVLIDEVEPKKPKKSYYVPTGIKPTGRPKIRTDEEKATQRVERNREWRERRGAIVVKINYNIKKCKDEGYEITDDIKNMATATEEELLKKYTAVLGYRATKKLERVNSVVEGVKQNYTDKGVDIGVKTRVKANANCVIVEALEA